MEVHGGFFFCLRGTASVKNKSCEVHEPDCVGQQKCRKPSYMSLIYHSLVLEAVGRTCHLLIQLSLCWQRNATACHQKSSGARTPPQEPNPTSNAAKAPWESSPLIFPLICWGKGSCFHFQLGIASSDTNIMNSSLPNARRNTTVT